MLLSGTAECFTAGNDVARLPERAARAGQLRRRSALFEMLPHMKKPVVAAVGGPAVGIGTTMLLHCDLVYAAPNARFQLPFVPLGIVPEFGSTFLLPLLAGYQRAAELLLLGQPFTAQKAHEAGIVTAVVPQEELLAEAEKAALALAACRRNPAPHQAPDESRYARGRLPQPSTRRRASSPSGSPRRRPRKR